MLITFLFHRRGNRAWKIFFTSPILKYSLFIHSVMPESLRPHGLHHTRLPVHHQLLELVQTHVCRVSDAIQPSQPLLSPSPPAFNPSQHQGLFQWVSSSHGGQRIGVSASASVLPMNIQDWFPLELTDLIFLLFKGLLRVLSNKSINSSALSFLYSPTLTSIHDHWKNHSLD